MTIAPLMHAAAQWTSFMWFFAGHRVVLTQGSLDPVEVWSTIERERVNLLTVVGDAVAKPLLDAWDAEPGAVGRVVALLVLQRGRPAVARRKARILATFPNLFVNDGFGSSEAGIQGSSRVTAADAPAAGSPVRFDRGTKPIRILDDDDREVVPGSGVVGRIVTGGRLPLGYLNDPEKTAATFLELDGERWLITGDLATVAEDGTVDLLGRGSTSINTGGEKVHAEEVEGVLHAHPSVADVLVVGVPGRALGERGHRGRAARRRRRSPSLDELAAHCRTLLAGYKVPKHLVRGGPRWCDRRAARPTTAGPSTPRSSEVEHRLISAVLITAGHGRSIGSGHTAAAAAASHGSVSDGGDCVGARARARASGGRRPRTTPPGPGTPRSASVRATRWPAACWSPISPGVHVARGIHGPLLPTS